MQNKLRHRQCRIAGDAQSDKFGLALVRKMRVRSLLLRHGALPARLATSGLIIVAREEPRLIRRLRIFWMDFHRVAALPPGKSARAVPESGIKTVSWMKAASPMT